MPGPLSEREITEITEIIKEISEPDAVDKYTEWESETIPNLIEQFENRSWLSENQINALKKTRDRLNGSSGTSRRSFLRPQKTSYGARPTPRGSGGGFSRPSRSRQEDQSDDND